MFVCCSLLPSGPATAAAIGPDPTATSINVDGTFAVATLTIAKTATLGFGGGTIYYPTATGTFGVVVLSPGFTATRTNGQQVARRLATHGLVTIAIDTNSTLDLSNSRGTQLRAALNYVTGASSAAVRSHVDAARYAWPAHVQQRADNREKGLFAVEQRGPWNFQQRDYARRTRGSLCHGMGHAPADANAALVQLQALHDLRVTYFGPATAQALYAKEEQLTRQLLQVMRLDTQTGLTLEQKAERAQQLLQPQ